MVFPETHLSSTNKQSHGGYMLVIGRGEKESVCIGENIEIYIDKIYTHNGKLFVKLSIDAPREIPIVRKELKTAKDAEGKDE
jgi:carbon storage regulator CsrA